MIPLNKNYGDKVYQKNLQFRKNKHQSHKGHATKIFIKITQHFNSTTFVPGRPSVFHFINFLSIISW